jgi:hypothetical protein
MLFSVDMYIGMQRLGVYFKTLPCILLKGQRKTIKNSE